MCLMRKLFIAVLIVLTFNLYLPCTAMTQERYAKADVPAHPPKSWSTPEIKIKEEKPKKGNWINRNKWYLMLGLVVLAGGAAAAVGGSDNGSGGGEDTGEVDYSW